MEAAIPGLASDAAIVPLLALAAANFISDAVSGTVPLVFRGCKAFVDHFLLERPIVTAILPVNLLSFTVYHVEIMVEKMSWRIVPY